jgi:hypothetical protein
MSYEKNGHGSLVHTPDAIVLNKQTPPLVRQLVALMLKHQADVARPGLRSLHIYLHERPEPTLRLSFELP